MKMQHTLGGVLIKSVSIVRQVNILIFLLFIEVFPRIADET